MREHRSAQRDLRAPQPTRVPARAAATADHLAQVAPCLTARDRWVVRMLAEHRVLTSTQLMRLAWPSRRATNHRLHTLYQWRLLNRFELYIGHGRAPMCYVLDATGAHLLAHERGEPETAKQFRPERSVGIAYSLRLAHLLGLNTFATDLVAAARNHPGYQLTAWWSEARCARYYGDHVRPDGYARWTHHNRHQTNEVEFFLEWDTGSYQLSRLVSKIPGYTALAQATGITTPVLLVFASADRESHARTLLADHQKSTHQRRLVPIATTTVDRHHTGPTGPIWQPLHTDDHVSLADLPSTWPHLPAPTPAATEEHRVDAAPCPMPPTSPAR